EWLTTRVRRRAPTKAPLSTGFKRTDTTTCGQSVRVTPSLYSCIGTGRVGKLCAGRRSADSTTSLVSRPPAVTTSGLSQRHQAEGPFAVSSCTGTGTHGDP